MINYYTYVIIITVLALGVFSILVYENDRIFRGKKQLFILTNIFIAIAAVAECAGIHMSGNLRIPKYVLIIVKMIDYTFTPMTGMGLIALMGKSDRKKQIFVGIFFGNAIFQLIAACNGWMITVDESNHYTHSVLYPAYVIFYSLIIIVLTAKMLSYGRRFRKQNRKSLYATIFLVFSGVAMQELIGQDCRVAYLTTAFGAVFIFIHYSEFSQLKQDDEISEQQIKISRDALTGVFSRFAYIDAIDAYADRGCVPENFLIFMIDINGLKEVNDTSGHRAGDELICGAAACIEATIGKNGRTFRVGGDEFVVFTAMSKKDLEHELVRIKHKTEQWTGEKGNKLSMSIGYVFADEYKGFSVEELVKEADREMYQEKKKYYCVSERDRRH